MNPYEVLDINHGATSHDIVQAAALALRERKYSPLEIAEARKKLMDPEARKILDFVHYVDIELLIKFIKGNNSTDFSKSLSDSAEGRLERLTIFDS